MDARLILAGRGINPVAAFDAADVASQNALATNQAYAMRDYYRQNGAQVLAGDQNALAGLAQIGPLGAQQAFDARANIQAEQTNSFNLEQAKIEAAQQTEAHLAKMSADQIAQEADNLRRLAETAALAKDPTQWDNTFRGTPYEGTWDKRDAVLAILGTQKEVLDRIAPPAPNPKDNLMSVPGVGLVDIADPNAPRTVVEAKPNTTNVTVNGSEQPTIGAIPQGYSVVKDPSQPSGYRMVAIAGGPEDTSAKDAAKAGAAETTGGVIATAAIRAREAAGNRMFGGVGQGIVANNPYSDSAEVSRQVGVLKSNATIESLNAMRRESPTGGALGNVTEGEGAMLAAKAGALDPSSPNFERDLGDYLHTLLRTIHGPKEGDKMFNQVWGSEDAPKAGSVLKYNPETGELE